MLTEAKGDPKLPIIGYRRDAKGNIIPVRASWEGLKQRRNPLFKGTPLGKKGMISRSEAGGVLRGVDPNITWLEYMNKDVSRGYPQSAVYDLKLPWKRSEQLRAAGDMARDVFFAAKQNVLARMKMMADQYGAERALEMIGVKKAEVRNLRPVEAPGLKAVNVRLHRTPQGPERAKAIAAVGYDAPVMKRFYAPLVIENHAIPRENWALLISDEFENLFGQLYVTGKYEQVTYEPKQKYETVTTRTPGRDGRMVVGTKNVSRDVNELGKYETRTVDAFELLEPRTGREIDQYEKTGQWPKARPGQKKSPRQRLSRFGLHRALWDLAPVYGVRADSLVNARTKAVQLAQVAAAKTNTRKFGLVNRLEHDSSLAQEAAEHLEFLKNTAPPGMTMEEWDKEFRGVLAELDDELARPDLSPKQKAQVELDLQDMKARLRGLPHKPDVAATYPASGSPRVKMGSIKPAIKVGAVGAVVATILSIPDVAYAYESNGSRAAFDKAIEILPSVVDPTGFYDVVVGLHTILSSPDPKKTSEIYGKAIGQGLGAYPEKFPGGTDITGEQLPQLQLPLGEKPETREDLKTQIDLGKTYEPHGNIPEPSKRTSSPIPKAHRPLYQQDPRTKEWIVDPESLEK